MLHLPYCCAVLYVVYSIYRFATSQTIVLMTKYGSISTQPILPRSLVGRICGIDSSRLSRQLATGREAEEGRACYRQSPSIALSACSSGMCEWLEGGHNYSILLIPYIGFSTTSEMTYDTYPASIFELVRVFIWLRFMPKRYRAESAHQ